MSKQKIENVIFFDNLKEITNEEASKNEYFKSAYNMAHTLYHFVITEINNHNAILMINMPAINPNEEKTIWLDNVSSELKQILIEKGILK